MDCKYITVKKTTKIRLMTIKMNTTNDIHSPLVFYVDDGYYTTKRFFILFLRLTESKI